MSTPLSVADQRLAREELAHLFCDGLGTLDVEEMADIVDVAVLDIRE